MKKKSTVSKKLSYIMYSPNSLDIHTMALKNDVIKWSVKYIKLKAHTRTHTHRASVSSSAVTNLYFVGFIDHEKKM